MKTLQHEELSQVSGGNNGVNLIVDLLVPTAQAPDIANILTQIFLGALDSAALAAIVLANPNDFNAIQIVDINIHPL